MTSNTSNADDIRVVVVGAGYAGLIATNRFLGSLTHEERRRIAVTVVNPRAEFVERIRLHQLVAGSRDTVTTPLAELLHPQADVVVGWAELIDPTARTVTVAALDAELHLTYDYLVYAVGSVAAKAVRGASEHAFRVGDIDSARAGAVAIRRSGPGVRVAVVGGGFTGVETAAEVAERHPEAEVTLFGAGQLVPDMRPAARRSITKTLRRLGVRVEAGPAIAAIDAGCLRLEGGAVRGFDVCLLAASFGVPDLAQRSGLAVDPTGRLRVDEHLRSVSHPEVLGAGDATVAPDAVASHLRMGCAVALPLGGQAAETLLAAVRRTAPPTLSVGFLVQCISLGRKTGYVQLVRPDDRPRGLHVGGRPGAVIKERICRMVLSLPAKEKDKPGSYSWPKGPRPDVVDGQRLPDRRPLQGRS
jgi:NADH dehydrogenase FAD-containing subunit